MTNTLTITIDISERGSQSEAAEQDQNGCEALNWLQLHLAECIFALLFYLILLFSLFRKL